MGRHLAACPASTQECTFTWNRWPLRCGGRYSELQPARADQLDYHLLLRDQRAEAGLGRVARRTKVQLRNFLTKRYPAVPVPRTAASSPRSAGDRAAADKEYDADGEKIDTAEAKAYRLQKEKQERAWQQDMLDKVKVYRL